MRKVLQINILIEISLMDSPAIEQHTTREKENENEIDNVTSFVSGSTYQLWAKEEQNDRATISWLLEALNRVRFSMKTFLWFSARILD